METVNLCQVVLCAAAAALGNRTRERQAPESLFAYGPLA